MIRKENTGLFLITGYGDALNEQDALLMAFAQCGIEKRETINFNSAVLKGYSTYGKTLELKENIILPVCCTSLTSNSPGTIISACIGIGLPLHSSGFTLIETFSSFCSQNEALLEVERLLKASSEQRNLELKDLRLKCVEHTVKKCGAVVALCPFFREEMEENGSMA